MEELKLILETVKQVSDGVLYVVLIHYAKSIIVSFMWVSLWFFFFSCVKKVFFMFAYKDEKDEEQLKEKLCDLLGIRKRTEKYGHYPREYTREYYSFEDILEKIKKMKKDLKVSD